MAGLILKLRPNEELLINGVVIQNGDRKARLRVKTDGASILRLKDAMRPEEATTPERRAYYVAQLAVAGGICAADARRILEQAIVELSAGERTPFAAQCLARAGEELAESRFYGVMRRLAEVIRGAPAAAEEEEDATNLP